VLLLFITCGTFHFTDLKSLTGPEGVLTLAAILIFMGAMGKSAQFPLHVWLPDAMEGPTAVSALIHAATMVAAGVYLVARCFPLFASHPMALQSVAVIGAISALMAASMAVVNNDIKTCFGILNDQPTGTDDAGFRSRGFKRRNFSFNDPCFF